MISKTTMVPTEPWQLLQPFTEQENNQIILRELLVNEHLY